MHLILLISTDATELTTAINTLPGAPRLITAATPQEAQTLLPTLAQPPFAILADGRGQVDLAAYCQQVRAFCPPSTALIAAIALAEAEMTLSAAFDGGADDVFFLPFNPNELLIRLKHHCQHHQLLIERQKLHQRALDNERLVTIGRLTASIVHSISNPLQAMRGALTLAMEDSHSPRDVEEYVRLTQQELARVANLVNRMRQLYRPQTDEVSLIHLPDLLRDTFETAQEEAMRQKVRIRDHLTLDVPAVQGAPSQLQLAFLSIVLTLIDIVGAVGGGELVVSAWGVKNKVQVDFTFPGGEADTPAENGPCEVDLRYGMAPMLELIVANGGGVQFLQQDQLTIWRIEFGPARP
jgi:signal transduction histidine kinase